jgi:hypothetical protein
MRIGRNARIKLPDVTITQIGFLDGRGHVIFSEGLDRNAIVLRDGDSWTVTWKGTWGMEDKVVV